MQPQAWRITGSPNELVRLRPSSPCALVTWHFGKSARTPLVKHVPPSPPPPPPAVMLFDSEWLFFLVLCCGIVTVWGLNTGRQRRTLVWLDIDFSKFMSNSRGPVGTQDGWSCTKSRDNLAAERRICKCVFGAAVCVLLVPASNINMLRLKNVVCVWPYFKKSRV